MTPRVLVAGVGNIFFGDDGFGVEVARRLCEGHLAPDVRIADFGIRGIHLAFEIVSGYAAVILIDAVRCGGTPGTLYVIEPDTRGLGAVADAHSMELQNVFAFVNRLGGTTAKIIIVGCEPGDVHEGIGLTDPVAHAVDETLTLVRNLTRRHLRRITKVPASSEALP
ncbi:MAG: hydrogenase maturation protease [Vulcanimicrobiaceae bacterium]